MSSYNSLKERKNILNNRNLHTHTEKHSSIYCLDNADWGRHPLLIFLKANSIRLQYSFTKCLVELVQLLFIIIK